MTAGRPPYDEDSIVKKLDEAFEMGFTDREACLHAGCSHQWLYGYCKKNPEYYDRKTMLRDRPRIKAKIAINKKLDEYDDITAKWYLERRSKNEFSIKTEAINTNRNIELKQKDLSKLTDKELKIMEKIEKKIASE